MLFLALCLGGAAPDAEQLQPVASIAGGRLVVTGAAGQGTVPVYLSADWTRRQSDVSRVLIIIHDASRDADRALRIARAAQYAAHEDRVATMLVAPQFLAETDVAAHRVTEDVLRWRASGWSDGEAAQAPSPLSSFTVLDTILARLADPSTFPALRRAVVAGYAAGAQLVQRYAVVGRGAAVLEQRGISVRYVVANPSAYLWFGDDRSNGGSSLSCTGMNRWPYSLAGAPDYVDTAEDSEDRYIKRDVVYLLAEGNTDREPPAGCQAAIQGPNRYARGMNYLFALELRHPNLVRHRILSVWGAGPDSATLFLSPCGLAALFDQTKCAAF